MPDGTMLPTTIYRVRATREDDWWLLAVDGMDVITQARRLDSAEATARDLIATWLNVDPDSIAVDVYVPELADLVEDVKRRREAANEAKNVADERLRDVARTATSMGLTLREVGSLLGLSHQRVQQLIRPREGASRHGAASV